MSSLLSVPVFLFALALFFGGYLLQFAGHALEGTDPGEVIYFKRKLGLPYVEFPPPRLAVRPSRIRQVVNPARGGPSPLLADPPASPRTLLRGLMRLLVILGQESPPVAAVPLAWTARRACGRRLKIEQASGGGEFDLGQNRNNP